MPRKQQTHHIEASRKCALDFRKAFRPTLYAVHAQKYGIPHFFLQSSIDKTGPQLSCGPLASDTYAALRRVMGCSTK